MNPKKVVCPICGNEMIVESWGVKRQMYSTLWGEKVSGESLNYIHYICNCGNKMNYEGTIDCWDNSTNDRPVKIGNKYVNTDPDLRRVV